MSSKNYESVKRFLENHPERFKEIQADYFRNAKELLSDAYCRRVLRSKYTMEYIIEHPELIIETRKRILAKRKKKAAKKRLELKQGIKKQ